MNTSLRLVMMGSMVALLAIGCGDDDNDDTVDASGDPPDGFVPPPDDADVGDDGAVDDDAAVACPDLQPTGDSADDLIISEVSPGEHVGLFNPTDTAIDLAVGDYELCQMPAYTTGLTGTVPAKGYLLVDWPAAFSDALAGEEVALYADIGTQLDFAEEGFMRDFVCWGTGSTVGGSRQALAGNEGLWEDGCVGAISLGQGIIRLEETDGTSAASYELGTAPALECAP